MNGLNRTDGRIGGVGVGGKEGASEEEETVRFKDDEGEKSRGDERIERTKG